MLGPQDLLNIAHVHFDEVQVTEPGFVLDALLPKVSQTPEGGINGSARSIPRTHTGRRNGVIYLLGLDALPKPRMADNAVAETDYHGDDGRDWLRGRDFGRGY